MHKQIQWQQMGKGSGVQRKGQRKKLAKTWCIYREKGLNDVCLDWAERFVFDDNEDLFLFFQVDEVTKPGFFGKSVRKEKTFSRIKAQCCTHTSLYSWPFLQPCFSSLSVYWFWETTTSPQFCRDSKEQTEDVPVHCVWMDLRGVGWDNWVSLWTEGAEVDEFTIGLSPGALPTTSKPYGLLFSGINIRYKIYNI